MNSDLEHHTNTLEKCGVSVDQAALEGIMKTYKLAVSNADARYVACSNADELKTVRENFLKKKLGLTSSDKALDDAVSEVCDRMKDERMKHRVPFYYLLANKFGRLSDFGGSSRTTISGKLKGF